MPLLRRLAVRSGLLLAGLLAALLAVLFVRASTLMSRQPPGATLTAMPEIDVDSAVELLAATLRVPTLSHQDPQKLDATAFAALRDLLVAHLPKTHAALRREIVTEHSLLYEWPGSDPAARPLLLMAHQDVVPVEPGTESRWTHPPFAGVVADEYVWGRGAIDYKSGVAGMLYAVEHLLAAGLQPRRTIVIALGHDEEVGGERGAVPLIERLRARGLRFEAVLDEGLLVTRGIAPGLDRDVALIGIAEKGYLTVELVAEADGGHSSMPPADSAAARIARAVDRLNRRQMPTRLSAPVRAFFAWTAPEMGLGNRLVLANLWLTSPLVRAQLTGKPETNALARTTTAPTMLEGSVKENILPIRARAVVNFRILPGDDIASVLRHVADAVDDPSIRITERRDLIAEPSPVSRADSPAFERLAGLIRALYPDTLVAPSLVVPATDSRHAAAVADDVYRFLPVVATAVDLKRIHGTDERIAIRDFARAVRLYAEWMLSP